MPDLRIFSKRADLRLRWCLRAGEDRAGRLRGDSRSSHAATSHVPGWSATAAARTRAPRCNWSGSPSQGPSPGRADEDGALASSTDHGRAARWRRWARRRASRAAVRAAGYAGQRWRTRLVLNLIGKGYPAPRQGSAGRTIQPSNRFYLRGGLKLRRGVFGAGHAEGREPRRALTMSKHGEKRVRDGLTPNAELAQSAGLHADSNRTNHGCSACR